MALRAEHGGNRPERPAAAAGAHREAATGLHLDYDRSTVRSAGEEVRRVRDQFGRLVAPGQPKGFEAMPTTVGSKSSAIT